MEIHGSAPLETRYCRSPQRLGSGLNMYTGKGQETMKDITISIPRGVATPLVTGVCSISHVQGAFIDLGGKFKDNIFVCVLLDDEISGEIHQQ